MGRGADDEAARCGERGGESGNESGSRCPQGGAVSGWFERPLGWRWRGYVIDADLAPVAQGCSFIRRRRLVCIGCGAVREVTPLDTEQRCGCGASRAAKAPLIGARTDNRDYAIYDRGPRLDEWVPYIPRAWSREDALGELAELLAPYPAGSPWRRRLVAARACGEDVAAAS